MPSVVVDPSRLRRARETAELSREVVALAVGVTYNSVQAYELGATDPSVRVLIALARLYQVTVEDLCRDEAPAGAR
jgi:DNA-binding XRE family transcriptional regulator